MLKPTPAMAHLRWHTCNRLNDHYYYDDDNDDDEDAAAAVAADDPAEIHVFG